MSNIKDSFSHNSSPTCHSSPTTHTTRVHHHNHHNPSTSHASPTNHTTRVHHHNHHNPSTSHASPIDHVTQHSYSNLLTSHPSPLDHGAYENHSPLKASTSNHNPVNTLLAHTHNHVSGDDVGLHNPSTRDASKAAHPVDDPVNTCVHDFIAMLQTYQMEFDSQSHIGRLPSCFTREFGDVINEYVILRDPNQNEFEVHVVRKANELFFDDGWFSLHDLYDIDFGAWIALTYVNPKLLKMRILTRLGVEVRYPSYNPPLRHLLRESGSNFITGSSVLHSITAASSKPKSMIQTYVKEMTIYDIYSGTLYLPWYGFGLSAFAFVFSDIVLVDNVGNQYLCNLKFGVDYAGELSCNVSGGWSRLLSRHGVIEGDRVKFSIAHYSASNVMYVCIYPRIRIEDYLDAATNSMM